MLENSALVAEKKPGKERLTQQRLKLLDKVLKFFYEYHPFMYASIDKDKSFTPLSLFISNFMQIESIRVK